MSKIVSYIKESFKELTKKVTWPNWSSLQSSAILVMVASLIFFFFVFVMDIVFKNIMSFTYHTLY